MPATKIKSLHSTAGSENIWQLCCQKLFHTIQRSQFQRQMWDQARKSPANVQTSSISFHHLVRATPKTTRKPFRGHGRPCRPRPPWPPHGSAARPRRHGRSEPPHAAASRLGRRGCDAEGAAAAAAVEKQGDSHGMFLRVVGQKNDRR